MGLAKSTKADLAGHKSWELLPARKAGTYSCMGEMRKITVEVDAKTLEAARADGAGVADTVREALKRQARARAWERLAKLRGKVKFSMTWQEMRGKDDE